MTAFSFDKRLSPFRTPCFAIASIPLALFAKKASKNRVKPPAPESESQTATPPPQKHREKKRPSAAKSVPRIRWQWIAIAGLLILMAIQMVNIARAKSATMDEQNHITRGVTYVLTGDLRLGRVHPPLINLLSGLPFLFHRNFTLPLDHFSWEQSILDEFAREWLWRSNHDAQAIVFRARLPIIALALLLALIAYAWARELFGSNAGFLALALVTLDPNIMAHGSVATNDLGVSCFATLSLYTFWRWLQQPSWQRALVATVALGLAQASKYSAVFLFPTLAIIAAVHWFLTPVEARRPRKPFQFLGWVALIALAMAVIVWAIYGFKMGQLDGQRFRFPASAYFNELRAMMTRVEQGNPTFLLGSYSQKGWWYYFPVAFVVKTPLPVLLLIGAACIFAWRTKALPKSLPLLIPVAVYFAGSMVATLNIGYRHLLPVLPLLLIFASQIAEFRWPMNKKMAGALALALLWLAIGTWSLFPHYLTYFNEAAGGPQGGRRILGDSNLDWGQDLIALRQYMQREGLATIKLGYFGSAFPEAYGINYEPLPGFIRNWWPNNNFPQVLSDPTPGVYAISVTNLQGTLFPNHNLYARFRDRKPDAIIGNSIYVYKLK